MYFAGMNQVRTMLARTPYFSVTGTERTSSGSVLPKLTKQGNLIAGAFTRVTIGALLNPFTVLKARYEVRMCVFRVQGTNSHVEPPDVHRANYMRTTASRAQLSPSCAPVPPNYSVAW